jgi:hypothetical protein
MLVGHGHPELREPTCPSAPHFLRLQIFDETRPERTNTNQIPRKVANFTH